MRSSGRLRGTVAASVFYGGLAVLLALILLEGLADVVPPYWARRIAFNSEGYLFALVAAAWIQLARPRLWGPRRWWPTAAVALACLVAGVLLLASDLPSRFRTLNETFIALALVIPYLMLRRPLGVAPLGGPVLIVGGIVAGVLLDPDGLVVNLAESFGFWILVPLALDVVDRGILDPDATTSRLLRYGFYTLLAGVSVTVSALGTEERVGGGIHAWLSYVGRIHESFVGVLLVCLYLAVALGRTGSRGAVPPGPERGGRARVEGSVEH